MTLGVRVSAAARGVLLTSALLPTGAERIHVMDNRSRELNLHGRYLDDCVSSECSSVSWRSIPYMYNSLIQDDLRICAVGHVAWECHSKHWQNVLQATEANCQGARDAGTLAFGRFKCEHNDLCSAVAARVAVLLTACGTGSGRYAGGMGVIPPAKEVTCQQVADIRVDIEIVGACRRLVKNQGNNLSSLARLGSSLLCGCDTLSPPGSRRSGDANFQRSKDNMYIVKLMSFDDATKQESLLQDRLGVKTMPPLLETHVYFDARRRAMVMKNFFDAEAIGLTAQWRFPEWAKWACRHDVSEQPWGVDLIWQGGYDVKPKPSKSAERAPLLAQIIRHHWKLKEWSGWLDMVSRLHVALRFLKEKELVDYSPLVSVWTASAQNRTPSPDCEPRLVGTAPRKCLLSPECFMVTDPQHDQHDFFDFESMSDHGHSASIQSQRCDLVCLTVVDYLMEYGYKTQLENLFKKRKWSKYDEKVSHLVQCMGDILSDDCREYLQMGCTQLWETNSVTLDELLWCREFHSTPRVPRIPSGAWRWGGCKPDVDWEDPDGDRCDAYEGMMIDVDDLRVVGSGGKNPVAACCAHQHKSGFVTFAPTRGQTLDENYEPTTASKLPARAWKEHGCTTEDSWRDQKGRNCADFYDGRLFLDGDWWNGCSLGRTGGELTPMEACCLEKKDGKVVYSVSSWLFNG